jgi:hypothetical protein
MVRAHDLLTWLGLQHPGSRSKHKPAPCVGTPCVRCDVDRGLQKEAPPFDVMPGREMKREASPVGLGQLEE